VPADDVLPDDLRSTLDRIGHTDILVGIPCFQSARTVGHVVTAVEVGLRKYFPDLRATILVSDGGSTDGTIETALGSGVRDRASELLVDPASPVPEKVGFVYRGIPGKGSAFRGIFEAARRLGASACAVCDSDLRSITGSWLDRLLGPVIHHGDEFVAPMYARHRFDGTITNSIAYPLTSALYGTRLRQPIGGDFGFSGELAAAYADATDVWDTDVARFGVDIWMTTVAIVTGRRVCQAALGAKLHDPKDPGKDLGPMFQQVVGSLFALAGKYPEKWMGSTQMTEPPTFGLRSAYAVEPVEVSLIRLTWKFVEGYVRNLELWREVLSAETLAEVARAIDEAGDRPEGLSLPAEVWIRAVYDFLVAYNSRAHDPQSLVDALIPLYFARTATFVQEVAGLSDEEAEARVDALVQTAVDLKPELESRWQEAAVPQRTLAEQPVGQGEPVQELAFGSA
jgi:glycosyltransferase involved in cell wall biosynthesis